MSENLYSNKMDKCIENGVVKFGYGVITAGLLSFMIFRTYRRYQVYFSLCVERPPFGCVRMLYFMLVFLLFFLFVCVCVINIYLIFCSQGHRRLVLP